MENIKEARWLNAKHTKLDCMYKHRDYGWVPFTADSSDNSPLSKYIFNNLSIFNIAEYVEPVVDLEVIRESKHQELKAMRDLLRITDTISYDGDLFTAGKDDDQKNMNTFYTNAVAMLSGVVPAGIFTWMSATNTPHNFTAEQIIVLAEMMKNKVQEIYARYWYARDVLLANATTKEEIDKIQFPSSIPM
jgi:hypothetical protein